MDCADLPTPRNLFVYSTRNLIQGLHTLGRHFTTVIFSAKIQKKKKKKENLQKEKELAKKRPERWTKGSGKTIVPQKKQTGLLEIVWQFLAQAVKQ